MSSNFVAFWDTDPTSFVVGWHGENGFTAKRLSPAEHFYLTEVLTGSRISNEAKVSVSSAPGHLDGKHYLSVLDTNNSKIKFNRTPLLFELDEETRDRLVEDLNRLKF